MNSERTPIHRTAGPVRLHWSRQVHGNPPGHIRIFAGPERILLSIEVGLHNPTYSLACFDWEGQMVWSQADIRGWLALPGSQYLISTVTGQPEIMDGAGQVVHQWDQGGITQAALHGDQLILAQERQVWAVNRSLRPEWSFTWPGKHLPILECLVEGAFYYLARDGEWSLWSCTPDGQSNRIAPLPDSIVQDARLEYARAKGYPVDPFPVFWRNPSFDKRLGCLLLANPAQHVVAGVELTGLLRWRRCLGLGCCGGVPRALPDGNYAASGGCNGVVSWLDANGRLLFQSLPYKGNGLEGAYSSDVLILPDGTAVAKGGRGLMAYNVRGEHVWRWPHSYIECAYEPTRRLLACSRWEQQWGRLEVLRMPESSA